ncbi:Armadillo-like helical [Metarhizium album ARSEF 1941]|uniref:Armadillo-like helical n=1 Tax=Metarhizium album (strain ARSEF 1941) TaxID=1081103 RepID=A0A0B2X590_METAS|nr:Armadillo-like helical [Metarhizium album ARSEF 1941]KHO00913.1 Armadillo-like helical [Metarhizium album ARSEF 1941]
MSSLKQFIRNVRAAKTIADERAVIQKESAAIRASFREESHDHGVRDLGHSNQYIVGLALCTLGNIASIEMSRDLFPEIETLISTSNPYIRRKAALCAMRICRKVPDLQEHFLEKAAHLLADRNHGVLLCGLNLVTSLCEADEEEGGEEGIVDKFRSFVPGLVKTLKGLSTSGYTPEHDVTGITDPFLQVKLLRLLRILAMGDPETSEQINDILAQVATNTDSSKNVGNSILYEAVRTILDIEADSGLRVLGVNILGKFLANRDNNIRYVALNTLIKVVAIEPNAVQRHRNTILECLRDPDVSIRRRALDLSFTLINENNVRVLIRELLAFLEVADNEFKPTMTSQIGIAADKFAPNKRWHFDTMLRVLSLAGNYVKEQILSSFVRLIATTPELQTYAVQKLYVNLKKDITQESLTQAGAWCVGEYADALLSGGQYEEEELVQEVKEHEVVDLFALILNSSYATQVSTEYIITALMKLTTRFSEGSKVERIRRLLQTHQTSLDVEVQQRAAEYSNLFSFDQIRRGVLEKMPPPQIKESSRVLGPAPTKKAKATNRKSRVLKPTEQDLLDLMDAPPTASGPTPATNSDLLADILGGSASTPPPSSASPHAPQPASVPSIMDLFGPGSGQPTSSQAQAPAGLNLMGNSSPRAQVAQVESGRPCYSANDLTVTIQVQRNGEGLIQATARFQNISASTSLSHVGLQAAVPKSQKLQLLNISSSILHPGADATQMMRISGCKGPLRLRLRIGYDHPSAGKVLDQELHSVTLSRIDGVNERVRLLRLELHSGPVKFWPGQWLDTYVPGVAKAGGLSITCAPSAAASSGGLPAPYLELAVQKSPDNAVAAWLWQPTEKEIGSHLHVRVAGGFVFPPPSHPRVDKIESVVFVAGGVGINPLRSMLSHIGETDGFSGLDVSVFYSSKLPDRGGLEDILFVPRIAALFAHGSVEGKFKIHLTGSRESLRRFESRRKAHQVIDENVLVQEGRLSAANLRPDPNKGDRRSSIFYVCGPPAMTDFIYTSLAASSPGMNTSPAQIVTERWW